MAVNDLQELQRRMNTQSLRDDAQMVQGIPARGQDPVIQQDLNKGMRGSEFEVIEDPNKGMRGVETLPIPPAPPSSLNAIFKKRVIDKDGTETDLLTEITEAFVDKMPVAEEEKKAPVNLQSLGRDALGFNPDTATPEDGGLIGMAAGMPVEQAAMGGGIRNFEGQVPGQGHDMEDNVFMPIVERNRGQQVATLAVSPDEYVVDAHTMSALGNGSADAGAKVMDNVVKSVREKAYGTDQQPNEISGLAALRPMIERV